MDENEGIKYHKQMAMTGKYPGGDHFGVQSQEASTGNVKLKPENLSGKEVHHPRRKGAR